jgi:hypothetical protein
MFDFLWRYSYIKKMYVVDKKKVCYFLARLVFLLSVIPMMLNSPWIAVAMDCFAYVLLCEGYLLPVMTEGENDETI